MQRLHLDALMVESFATADEGSADGFTIAVQPGLTDGFECTRTLEVSCDTCKCLTPRYNCV